MMNLAVIDTLKFADQLKNAGFPPPQAEGLARALGDELGERMVLKRDLDDAVQAMNRNLDNAVQAINVTIETLDAKIESRFEAMDQKLESRFEGLDQKFGYSLFSPRPVGPPSPAVERHAAEQTASRLPDISPQELSSRFGLWLGDSNSWAQRVRTLVNVTPIA